MRYRIEYVDGRCCSFADSRAGLIGQLKLMKNEIVSDIRKVYRNGVSDSVLESYEKHIAGGTAGNGKADYKCQGRYGSAGSV